MNHFIQSHLVRKAAETAAHASASSVGSLPSASTANSAGASTNAAEISRTLDPLLNRLNEEERLTISEENVANRLRRLCDMYPESQIPIDLQPWLYDNETLNMVRFAADCAEAVYKRNPGEVIPALSDGDYIDVYEMDASQSGAYKATTIKVHKPSNTLVVAVRGTKKTSPIDWITNANGAPEDATDFLPGALDVKAHSGFLYAARSMYDPIIAAIRTYKDGSGSVLLTGHSAGGAVAALLFARLRLTSVLDIPVHCVTFAAPPVIAPKGIENNFPVGNPGGETTLSKFLAFAAHGDIVVRADRPYIRKILEIYSTSSTTSSTVPIVQFEPPELHNAGKLVILFDKNPDGDDDEIGTAEGESAIQNFLWGNVTAHRMKWYCEMLTGLSETT